MTSSAWTELALTARTVGIVASLMYMLLPVGVWWILRHQDRPSRLRSWVIGNLLGGFFIILMALRHTSPLSPVALTIGMAFGLVSVMLRGMALHHHMGRPVTWRIGLSVVLVLLVGFDMARRTGMDERMIYVVTTMMAGTGWLAVVAWRLATTLGSTSASAMSLCYGAISLLLVWRLWNLTLGAGESQTLDTGVNGTTLTLVMLFSAVFSNIAYIGITLEGVRAREQARRQEAVRATVAQRQSEAQSAQLRELLRERDGMLHLLAHEVRQPLNNASAALQSARTAASDAIDSATGTPLVVRLDRAGAVIRQITSILDNTLAASSLISSDSRLAPVEADLPSLVELCLADLAPPQRARVRVEHDPGLRTAAFDPGLLRLALRNLLLNGLRHSPPDTAVVLRVSEQDEPLAVLFEVIDQGPGFDPALRAHAFERGVRGPLSTGLGLGLYIVRRVAELHHGQVEIVPPEPDRPCTRLRLTLPQDPID
ncbi:MAG: hypothetical protein RLY71_2583 [Pseudomonadota bacterium]|jgi:signal transduction histidine kinase